MVSVTGYGVKRAVGIDGLGFFIPVMCVLLFSCSLIPPDREEILPIGQGIGGRGIGRQGVESGVAPYPREYAALLLVTFNGRPF